MSERRGPATPAVAGLLVASAASLLWSIHLILFRRTDLGLVAPAPWIVIAALLFAGAVIAGRRHPDKQQLPPTLRWLDLRAPAASIALLLFALLLSFSMGFERATADGRDYFAQTRSVVLDQDLDFSNEIEIFRTPGVAWVMPPGTAVAWVPFFVAAHAWIKVLGAVGFEVFPDGFWNPYQQAVGLGTLLLGYVGLVLLYRMLRRHHESWLAATVTWSFTLGTFVLYYLTVEATYAHGMALFAVMLFITLFLALGSERTGRQLFVLGLAAGFMISVRWENAAFLLLPLVQDGWPLAQAVFKRRWRSVLPYGAAVFGALIGFLPQVLIWGKYQGKYVTVPEMWGEQWWNDPMPLHVLFSSDRGLMSWHPLFFLAALGLPLAWRRAPRFVATMIAIAAILVYVNAASSIWAGGAGFGYRRLIMVVPLFALGLAELVGYLLRRPRVAVAAGLATIVALNLAMVGDAASGRLPIGEGTTFVELQRSLYRRIGNPFAAPATIWYWLAHGVQPFQYGQLGRRTFNSVDINVGDDSEGPFLLRGWGGPERDPFDEPFRWIIGQRAGIAAPLKERGEVGGRNALPDYTLELTIQPYRTPDVRQQHLSVYVNDELVADRLPLSRHLDLVTIEVPRKHLTRYLNFVDLHFDWAVSPKQLGLSDDDRLLSARVTRILLRRTEP